MLRVGVSWRGDWKRKNASDAAKEIVFVTVKSRGGRGRMECRRRPRDSRPALGDPYAATFQLPRV
jgi:hypothetical protein